MSAPPQHHRRESLDLPGQNRAELWGLLRDIRRVNRWYGGYPLIRHYLRQFLTLIPGQPVTVLDVATGSADVPAAVVRWARRHGIAARVTALDRNPDILELARAQVAAYPEIRLVQADALCLPFADRSVDIVLCSLALHHFTLDEGVRVLREIDRVARAAFLVSDVLRAWTSYLGAWLDTRLLSRNRLTRHDGPLSVLRSFTVPEFSRMAHLAGCGRVAIRIHPLFRLAMARQRLPGGTR